MGIVSTSCFFGFRASDWRSPVWPTGRSYLHQKELGTRASHLLEVRVRGEQRHTVAQGIGGYEQIDRLDSDSPPTKRIAEVAGFFPQM